jgi:hypothetical protein
MILGMKNNIEDLEKVRSDAEKLYKALKPVYCPYLKNKIHFNTQGLEHIKFKQRGRARSPQDQYMRLKLVHLVPEVLRMSHTLQGTLENKQFERTRINSRTEDILKPVNYYEFIAVIKRNRIKVIIKQIDNGELFFWSLIPFWGMNEVTMSRILYDGLPEED